MKKILRIVLVLVVIAVVIGWFYRRNHRADGGALILYGNIDIREVSLGFRAAGRLAKLSHDEGDTVAAGAVLAALDDEPYRNQVAREKAQVDSMEARLRLRQSGNRPQEIAQAKSQVREREVMAANAERLFKRTEEMMAVMGVSMQDRDNAEAGYREAAARLASAQENLALLEAGFRAEDIAQSKADLAQAEAVLASAQLQLKDTVLVAPSDGVILTRVHEVGAVLPVGATVFTLSLRNPVWVRVYANEMELGRIHSGGSVEIYTNARPEKPYHGQVGFISPRAEFTPKTVETAELRTALVYRLRIVVSDPDEGLRQGMPVTVKLAAN